MSKPLVQSTGRRKEAVARARLRDGEGKITINGRVIKHAKLVPNQKGIVARNVVITKDNYQQFVD